ncbi:MAG: hypothetical protein FWD57_16500 [Polyangiaceae bacterium]|nr:hypothetical protein [Polyangiaceae bacterium]
MGGNILQNSDVVHLLPVQVLGFSDVFAIDAGDFHNVALKSDGTVWMWGDNDPVMFGNGLPLFTPVPVQGLADVVSVGISNSFAVALKADGTVWTWGDYEYSVLGDSASTTRVIPQQIPIADVESIAVGGNHVVALKPDGTVWTFGFNRFGQLGYGTFGEWGELIMVPAQVPDLAHVVSVGAGSGHSVALKADGTVWAWGANEYGRLGDGTTTDRASPVQMVHLTDVVSVAGCDHNTLAIKSDGTVWSTGRISNLNNGSISPVQVQNLSDIVKVAGTGNNFAVKSDGTVWSWGLGGLGGNGSGTKDHRHVPAKMVDASGKGDFNLQVTSPP